MWRYQLSALMTATPPISPPSEWITWWLIFSAINCVPHPTKMTASRMHTQSTANEQRSTQPIMKWVRPNECDVGARERYHRVCHRRARLRGCGAHSRAASIQIFVHEFNHILDFRPFLYNSDRWSSATWQRRKLPYVVRRSRSGANELINL